MTKPTSSSVAQASHVDFALHTLGWKAFQDLAVAVAAEVLQRPVQSFLPSNDGGRDGAFVGTWAGVPDTPDVKSTIQCKFTGKVDATLRLSTVANELDKVPSLAERGLAHDYILLTNAAISGQADAEIVAAIQAAGALQARVLGREWLTQEIRNSPRLRMMVPRLYGLGDLSQIIDERAYVQARWILSAMGDDLSAFVTTSAHRQSVEALRDHKFVLLLGDPASGKSTIGASLAIGALDDGAIGTLKLSNGDAFEQHWNPNEPNQFFWIDDAFGETQYQRARVDGWNSRLKLMRAAVKAGARVLMTSRTYIWNAAQRDLKLSEFPPLTNSQVIIDVQGLSDLERAQILFNHIRLGDQSSKWRNELKSFLPAVAINPRFLPETARRLGSPFFTKKLALTADDIQKFIEEPLPFLKDVLRNLGEPDRAAIALIFVHGSSGVPSPFSDSESLETVCRLSGVDQAAAARAMEAMRGSLVLLVETDIGRRWIFKHPTIADAYAELVAESPELIELYIRGAKREKLMSEVVCGQTQLMGASVQVPSSLYDLLLDRIGDKGLLDSKVLQFSAYRGDPDFLRRLVVRAPDLTKVPDRISSDMSWNSELSFIAKLHACGLLPEAIRKAAVERIVELSVTWADAAPFSDDSVQALFTEPEFSDLTTRFRREIVDTYAADPDEWNDNILSSDPAQNLRDLKDSISTFAALTPDDDELAELARIAEITFELRIDEIEEMESESEDRSSPPSAPSLSATDQLSTIFDDVDD